MYCYGQLCLMYFNGINKKQQFNHLRDEEKLSNIYHFQVLKTLAIYLRIQRKIYYIEIFNMPNIIKYYILYL